MRNALLAFSITLAAPMVAAAQQITIVSYNAENLFDTSDDITNPHDNTYLPLSVKTAQGADHERSCLTANPNPRSFYFKQCISLDWSESVYKKKIANYADVINAMPSLPHVLVIPETENKAVLDDLTKLLPGSGQWTVIQLDSSDKPNSRGIDVGMISRLPTASEPVAHKIDFGSAANVCDPTRDILHARFKLPDNAVLNVFGVHFPSGSNPFECRSRAFVKLNELAAALPKTELKVAAGDFNLNCAETQTDGMDRLLLRGDWYLSPLAKAGCSAPGSSKFIDRNLYNWNTWSFLDLILVSSSLSPTQESTENWWADLGSFGTVVVTSEQYTVDDANKGFVEPRRFDPATQTGVSDHWPVAIRLMPRRH